MDYLAVFIRMSGRPPGWGRIGRTLGKQPRQQQVARQVDQQRVGDQ